MAIIPILVFGSVAAGAGQTSDRGSPSVSVGGKESFVQFCASCHGAKGKGNGPAASALRTRPADLTTIAKRKGKFSAVDVEAAIRGSDVLVPAHGSAEMPVWGHYFTAVDRNDHEARVRIANLVKFIESIQVK